MSAKNHRLAVLMPVFNGGDRLRESMSSCANAGLAGSEYEIIVVDNCSSDRAPDKLPQRDAGGAIIQLHRNSTNIGRVGNWNRSVEIALAQGFQYLTFLFAGDRWIRNGSAGELLDLVRESDTCVGFSPFTIADQMCPLEPQPQTSLNPHLTLTSSNDGGYRYHAYGLAIRSQIPLPEFSPLAASDAPDEATVAIDAGAPWVDSIRGGTSVWSVLAREACFWFPRVGGFLVRNGREIVIAPEPGVDASLLRMYVEGMMIACLLHQRGFFVLHASVVQMGNYAVAFLGHVGAGKSTLAAALHARGYGVVTDDNAAIGCADPEPLVTPAFPSVKVYPDIATYLGYQEPSLIVMHDSQRKRATFVERGFPVRPVPLRRIYVLDRTYSGTMARLSPGESTLELIRNSVPTRWAQPGNAAHLAQCGGFSRKIPAWANPNLRQRAPNPRTCPAHRNNGTRTIGSSPSVNIVVSVDVVLACDDPADYGTTGIVQNARAERNSSE
jgi:hypothetical protein